MTAQEVWLPVIGYEGVYEASNLGHIRRVGATRPLVPNDRGAGYLAVSLPKDGRTRNFMVHRIVLEAFCGPAPFDGAQAAHNDGNRANPCLTNLRWATRSENQADRIRHKTDRRGEAVFGAKLTEDGVRVIKGMIARGFRNPEIANRFGVSISTVHLIRHDRTWRHVA
ncbi:HNH endonuclease [Sphingomonas sp. Leaf10]|uniref:HNH endonuclease n=1 Tax=Sphingomonas sp. Leaf10 TaxID=1735676 RepID=UPI0009EB6663|nr:HNH endonuclease [Sphingomonas sp. Leaf10]